MGFNTQNFRLAPNIAAIHGTTAEVVESLDHEWTGALHKHLDTGMSATKGVWESNARRVLDLSRTLN